jgi:hypothetical protein
MIGDMFKFGFGVVGLLIGLFGLIGIYKAFVKAGKPGFLAFIPILNLLNMLHLAGKPLWWALLFLVPGLNVVIAVLLSIAIAERFGKGWLFGLCLMLPPTLPFCWGILGFGEARFQPAR